MDARHQNAVRRVQGRELRSPIALDERWERRRPPGNAHRPHGLRRRLAVRVGRRLRDDADICSRLWHILAHARAVRQLPGAVPGRRRIPVPPRDVLVHLVRRPAAARRRRAAAGRSTQSRPDGAPAHHLAREHLVRPRRPRLRNQERAQRARAAPRRAVRAAPRHVAPDPHNAQPPHRPPRHPLQSAAPRLHRRHAVPGDRRAQGHSRRLDRRSHGVATAQRRARRPGARRANLAARGQQHHRARGVRRHVHSGVGARKGALPPAGALGHYSLSELVFPIATFNRLRATFRA